MANDGLRIYAAGKGVRLWQVADRFGITDSYFSKKMRKELSKQDAERFRKYVDKIAEKEAI